MKLKPLYIVLIVVVLVLMYFLFSMMKSGKSLTQTMTEKVTNKVMDAVQLKCEMTDEGGKSEVYVKNKMIRTDTLRNGKPAHLVMKNWQMWVWEDEKGEGMTWNLPTPATTQNGDMPDFGSLGAMMGAGMNLSALSQANQNNANCKPASFGDDKFEIPTSVTFKSFDDMLKQIPGANGAGSDVQKMIQEQMQKAVAQ